MGIEVFAVCSFLLAIVVTFNVVHSFIDGFISLSKLRNVSELIKVDKVKKFFR